jgi:hypothetical protein
VFAQHAVDAIDGERESESVCRRRVVRERVETLEQRAHVRRIDLERGRRRLPHIPGDELGEHVSGVLAQRAVGSVVQRADDRLQHRRHLGMLDVIDGHGPAREEVHELPHKSAEQLPRHVVDVDGQSQQRRQQVRVQWRH